MTKRLIITEAQLERLKITLNENAHSSIVKRIKDELDKNYEPVGKFVREGGAYSEKGMFKIKADGEVISPKNLLDYLNHKYPVSDKFIKQVIKDWVSDEIADDYTLSKNVALN